MRKTIYGIMVWAVGSFTCSSAAYSQKVKTFETEKLKVTVERIVTGIDTPWAMAMLPNGELLVTQRDGRMVLVDDKNRRLKRRVSGVPDVWANGQGGLLDVVLDPDFENNQTIYFTYSDPSGSGEAGTAIASAVLETGLRPKLTNVRILYSMARKTGGARHFGSRIVPDGKGNLWFTIGDRGQAERAQDPKDGAGSVMRIRTDGSIPPDNPFADGKEGLPQLWSYGHRNAQGATLNEKTGALWTLSHGARGGDEINIPEAGKNYGWPVVSYGTHYSGAKIGIGSSAPGYEQPIFYWDPSIAPSGFDFYEGGMLPEWEGNLFAGALKYEMLVRLEVEGNRIVSEERLFADEYGRVRDVRSFHDGALWFLTDDGDGKIYRVTKED